MSRRTKLGKLAPRYVSIPLTQDTYDKFIHKCHYYEISSKEVLSFCVNKFNRGDFDKELELPVD